LDPRVEEALDLASIGVNSRQICSLESVAEKNELTPISPQFLLREK